MQCRLTKTTRLLVFVLTFHLGTVGLAKDTKRVLLIGQQPDGHPKTTHEYTPGVRLLAKLLSRSKGIQTVVVSADGDWADGPELLDGADAAVVFVSQGAKWIQEDAKRLAAFQALAKRGGGLVCLHWGMGTRDAKNIPAWLKLFGGCHGGPDRRYKVVDVKMELGGRKHPILNGVKPIDVHEEFYFKLKLVPSSDAFIPLIKANIEEELHTVSWAWNRPDGGRSFGFSGLHFHSNWNHESYRRLMTQAILWTVDREIPSQGIPVDVKDIDLTLSTSE